MRGPSGVAPCPAGFGNPAPRLQVVWLHEPVPRRAGQIPLAPRPLSTSRCVRSQVQRPAQLAVMICIGEKYVWLHATSPNDSSSRYAIDNGKLRSTRAALVAAPGRHMLKALQLLQTQAIRVKNTRPILAKVALALIGGEDYFR